MREVSQMTLKLVRRNKIQILLARKKGQELGMWIADNGALFGNAITHCNSKKELILIIELLRHL